MIILLVMVFVLLFIYLVGANALRFFKLKQSGYEHALFSFGLGGVITALGIFYLGIFKLLYKELFLALFILVVILSFSEFKRLFSMKLPRPGVNLNTLFFLGFIALFAGNIVMSLAPNFEIDSLVFHTAVPRVYAFEHAVVEIPFNLHAYEPHGIQMLYVITELFGFNEQGPQLIAASFSALAALAAAGITHKYFSRKAAGFAAILFYSMPMIIERSSQPMVDVPLAFFGGMAFFSFLGLLNDKKNTTAWLILTSIFAASLSYWKITSIFAHVAVGAVLLFWLVKTYRASPATLVRYLFISGMVMIIIAGPWFLWVFSHTGDPLYPYFGFITEDPASLKSYEFRFHLLEAERGEYGGPQSLNHRGLLRYLSLPALLTFKPFTFNNVLGMTPFFLMFLPLFAFKAIPQDKRRMTGYALLIFFVYLLIWQFTNPSLRYIFPVLLMLVPSTAYAIFWVLQRSRYRYVIAALIILLLLFSGPVWAGIAAKRIPGGLGLVTEEQYLADAFYNPIKAIKFVNANTPDDAYIYIFRESRAYRFERRYLLGEPHLQHVIDYDSIETPEEFYIVLKEMGFTHIVFGKFNSWTNDANRLTYNTDRLTEMMEQLIQEQGTILYEDDVSLVVEI